MQLEEAYCQNTRCRKLIVIISGHRRRQYCDDGCKQMAHRLRQEEARLAAEEAARQAQLERDRAQLRKQFGNLLPETIDLLQAMPECASRIAKVIRAEQESARQSQAQERNELIEYIMLAGEHLGFPVLINDDFRLEAGVDNWLALCQDTTSLEQLYQARDIAHIKLRAQEARKRLAQFVPQS